MRVFQIFRIGSARAFNASGTLRGIGFGEFRIAGGQGQSIQRTVFHMEFDLEAADEERSQHGPDRVEIQRVRPGSRIVRVSNRDFGWSLGNNVKAIIIHPLRSRQALYGSVAPSDLKQAAQRHIGGDEAANLELEAWRLGSSLGARLDRSNFEFGEDRRQDFGEVRGVRRWVFIHVIMMTTRVSAGSPDRPM